MTKPTSLSCNQCVERLGDFVDRELTAEELALVEAHLDRCLDCAREFRFEGTVVECIKDKLRHVNAPDSLLEKIRGMLGS